MKITGNGLHVNRISLPRLAWLLAAVVMFWNLLYVNSDAHHRQYIIGSDGAGYYAYLPAMFIYHDMEYKFCRWGEPEKLPFPATDNTLFMNQTVEGKLINKYFVGTAILELPFFLIAYGTAPWFGHHANGYSFPFQIAIALAAMFYTLLGLEQVRRLLNKKNIAEHVQAVTILLLFFGTNLMHYTLSEPSMSHAFSFAMVALFLNQAHNIFHDQNRRAIIWTILALTMVVLIRPVNGVVILAVPLIAGSWSGFLQGLRFIFSNVRMLVIGMSVFALLVFIQLLMYKMTVGKWVADSYAGEHLDLTNVHFYNLLFSWRKGWFIYTPVMIFAVIGIFFLRSWFERAWAFLFLLVNIWVIASWQLWTYGGSLGMRPMIDSYAVMAIPLAFFLQRTLVKRVWIGVAPLLAFVTVLNLVQHYQFRIGILPYDGMTKERYVKLFFRTNHLLSCIYDPGSIHTHTLPGYTKRVAVFKRTFEEEHQDHLGYWGVTPEKAFSGKHAVKLDTAKVTAGLCVPFKDAVPDSVLPKTWVVVKAKVFLVDDRVTPKMAVSFRSGGQEYNFQAEPLFFEVDETGSWQDYEYAIEMPEPPGPDGEMCIFLLHDDHSVAYADDMQIEFWVEE